MIEVDNLLGKVIDPMTIMIRIVRLMAGYFWIFLEFLESLYFYLSVHLEWLYVEAKKEPPISKSKIVRSIQELYKR